MNVLESQIQPRSPEFKANAAAVRALVEDLRAKARAVAQGGGQAARDKHVARGKLLPRDRVDRLLDPGTPFLEVGQLAALGMYDDQAPAAGLITGIGRVSGVECMIVANDATVKGGTYYPLTVKKHLRAQEVAAALWGRPCATRVRPGLVVPTAKPGLHRHHRDSVPLRPRHSGGLCGGLMGEDDGPLHPTLRMQHRAPVGQHVLLQLGLRGVVFRQVVGHQPHRRLRPVPPPVRAV